MAAETLETTPTGEPTFPDHPWVAIVANPFSGARGNRLEVDRLAAALTAHGLAARVIWDRDLRLTALRHPDLQRTCTCIVAAGGDGTVADVFNERTDLPLAVLPLGNENLLARHFGFTAGPDALAEAILKGQHRSLDLGQIQSQSGEPGRKFSLMLSVGLDAEVVRRLSAWRAGAGGGLRRVRRWTYAMPTFSALAGYAYPQIELDADGHAVRGAHAFVFNLPAYAMQLPFSPDSCGDDGLLDWVVFERPGPAAALGYLADLFRGKHLTRKDVRRGKAQRITLTSEPPAPIQADGDAAGVTPVRIGVLPCAIKIIAAG
jgi:diacylglycerol kinase family enzyme